MDNHGLFEYIVLGDNDELNSLWIDAVYDSSKEDDLYGAISDIPDVDIDSAWDYISDRLMEARDDMPVPDIEDGDGW